MASSEKPYLDPNYQAVQEAVRKKQQTPPPCGEEKPERPAPVAPAAERVCLVGFNPWGSLLFS